MQDIDSFYKSFRSIFEDQDCNPFAGRKTRLSTSSQEIKEDGSAILYVDLPGVVKEDVALTYKAPSGNNNVDFGKLSIVATRKIGANETTINGEFHVNAQYDWENMKASMKEGVLILKTKKFVPPDRNFKSIKIE